MASIKTDPRTGNWLLSFRYGGRQFCRSTGTYNRGEARSIKARVEDTIRFLKQGRIVMPPDAEPGTFILSEGRLSDKPKLTSAPPLAEICDSYLAGQHDKARTTIDGERRHIGHLREVLGDNCKLADVTMVTLQDYVTKRTRTKFRGKPVTGPTVRKELVTFSQVWGWARERGHVASDCPIYNARHKWGIDLPKPAQKEPFQTYEQIESRIARGKLGPAQQTSLWRRLFLDNDQILELLEHVRTQRVLPFVYPMFVFAAYTGARRSEIRRSRVEDFDFSTGLVTIREKKRKKSLSESTRFVPIHARLAEVMQAWIAAHPGGEYTFVAPLLVARRKVRKETMRMTETEANHHFRAPLRGSKWDVVRGFHVIRHSFAANCARAGVKRERVAEWMGHTTQEMADLYQHLFPQDGPTQIAALK